MVRSIRRIEGLFEGLFPGFYDHSESMQEINDLGGYYGKAFSCFVLTLFSCLLWIFFSFSIPCRGGS